MRGQIKPKSKGVWLIRIESRKNGKRTSTSKQIHGTKKDAEKHLTAWLRDMDKGIFIEPSRKTIEEHLDKWLEVIKSRIAEQTYNSYEMMVRIHIKPRIGHKRLSEVKIFDIQNIISEMEKAGLSSRTIRYAHTVLSMALNKAVEWGCIFMNPCQFSELPRQDKKETKAFSDTQAKKFLKHSKDNKHGLIFEFALLTGMRPEEYLALKWADIDFRRGVATVQNALVWQKGGGFKFAEPKTAKSRRAVPLPKSILPKLKEHKKRQENYIKSLKPEFIYEDHSLVFTSESGTPINPRNLAQRHFEKILENAGMKDLGFVLYSLRHSCATLLLIAGENPKVVAERLGHTSIKMTLDTYSHVLPNMQKSATDRLEKMLY